MLSVLLHNSHIPIQYVVIHAHKNRPPVQEVPAQEACSFLTDIAD